MIWTLSLFFQIQITQMNQIPESGIFDGSFITQIIQILWTEWQCMDQILGLCMLTDW